MEQKIDITKTHGLMVENIATEEPVARIMVVGRKEQPQMELF